MFEIFRKTKKNRQLEEILQQLEMNASNNYKDAAQASLREFEKMLKEQETAGKIEGKQREYYEEKLSAWKEQLKKFTHADQKATWT